MSKVGPGNPPKGKRFRKGVSGNPSGRPKKKRAPDSGSAFDPIIDKTLTITQDGESREVTVEEGLQHKTYQDAIIAGDRSAQREILKMIAKREKYFAARKKKTWKPRTETKIESSDPTNADEALLVLGIATRNPARKDWGADREQLLLEPWAVQAALSRRRGGSKLTEHEINEIRRRTRDAVTLRWPRGTDE